MIDGSRRTAADTSRQLANIILAATQAAAPALFLLGVGEDIGTRSDRAPTLITPPTWTFAIWSVLYPASFVYAVYQALPRNAVDPLLRRLGWATAGAFLANTLWAVETVLSGVSLLSAGIIIAMLACLIYAVVTLADRDYTLSTGQKYLVAAPVSALAAWITAATIVNIASALVGSGVEAGESAGVMGAVVIAVGAAVATAVVARTQGNPWYSLVFCWALAGIAAASLEPARREPTITVVAVAGIAAVAAAAFLTLRRGGRIARWFGTGSAGSTHA
jgi:branched-subunit amino acid transport protein